MWRSSQDESKRFLAVYTTSGWEVIDTQLDNYIVHVATDRFDALAQENALNNRDKLQQI